MMRNKTPWLLSILILLAILLVSCAPAVSEKEEKLVIEAEEVRPVVKEEEVKEVEESVSGDVEEAIDEAPSQEPESQEPQPQEPESQEPEPQEPETPAPQLIPEEEEVPVHKYQALVEFALELINRDRAANGLDPVELRGNVASQNHAEENLAYAHSSHWSVDGLKPYMRYTLAGGVNYVGENVIGTGIESHGDSSGARDIQELLEQAQERFMDSPGHRANILNKWHKKISMGIAFDDENFHWVQHFEGDYIKFSELPSISGTIFSMVGKVTVGKFERIILYYDPLPQPLTPEQLNAPPYDSSYGLGGITGNILPPLPSGSFYTNLAPTDVVAMTWITQTDGSFAVEANISSILGKGNGVYTIVVLVETGGEYIEISNYSIFVE